MKNIGLVISLSFLVLLLFVTPVMSSDDWVEYYRTEDGSVSLYNKKTITKSRGMNIVQVWVKWIISDEERERVIEVIRKNGLSTEGWGKLSHMITLDQIDCNNKKYRILSMSNYNKDGKVLSSSSSDNIKWDYIVPDTNENTLLIKVCK